MLFHSSEMDVEDVEMFQKDAERGAFGHLGESVDVLGETFAAIAVLAVGSRRRRYGCR